MPNADHIVIVAGPDGYPVEAFRQHFTDLGFDVARPKTGPEIRAFAAEMVARLVILDLDTRLPAEGERVEAEACRACVALRLMPAYEHAPIIMLTGAGTPRIRTAAARAGVTTLLVKPLSVHDLMREIDRLGVEEFRVPRRDLPVPEGGRAGKLSEVPMKVWNPSPSLTWNFGEKSKLAEGRRFLQTLRRSTPTRR